MTTQTPVVAARPWYREPWPWIVMAGPAIVVVAGAVTTVLAVRSADGLVADDYYKQGLAINRQIERDRGARTLGVQALVQFSEDRTRVRVVLGEGERPAAVKLSLAHPTLAGEDQALVLEGVAPGVYEGAMKRPRQSRFHLKLEDGAGRWRLAGEWNTAQAGLRLLPR